METGLQVVPVMAEIFASGKVISRGASVAVVSHAAAFIKHCQGARHDSHIMQVRVQIGGGTGCFRGSQITRHIRQGDVHQTQRTADLCGYGELHCLCGRLTGPEGVFAHPGKAQQQHAEQRGNKNGQLEGQPA